MIVHGGPPPFIEEPNPRFGGVIKALNEFATFVAERTENFSSSTQERLIEFTQELDGFVRDVAIPITDHISSTGAVHGETKGTIGLSLKDNFRAATLAEQIALARVDAFVTSQGAKAAIQANAGSYVANNYQQNDVIQMASYFFPDEYPTLVPSAPEPVRFFNGDGKNNTVSTLLNGDRLVLSAFQPAGRYQRQSLFVSGPTNQIGKTLLQEVQNVTSSYSVNGWNNIAGQAANGKVAFFHPIADKNIYEFTDNTGLPVVPSKAHLIYQGFGGVVYKGMGASAQYSGDTALSIVHRFFSVTALATNPTMNNVVDTSYLATFRTPSETRTGPIQATHNYNLADFFQLPAGATVKAVTSVPLSVSLFWNAQDIEAYLFVACPVIVTLADGKARRFILRFVESIRPGTLRAGSSGAIQTLGLGAKDVIGADLAIPAGATWIEQDDPSNFNSPLYSPGAVLVNGEVVKTRSSKYGITVKRYKSNFAGIRDWVLGNRPVVPLYEALTETNVPARHLTFGPLPERIIPVQHSGGNTVYLAYGLDIATGRYNWQEIGWTINSMVGATVGNKFGIRSPDYSTVRGGLSKIPNGVVSVTNLNVDGATVTGMAFNKENQYKAYTTFTYSSGVLVLGTPVTLSPLTLFSLQAAAATVVTRAKTVSPLPSVDAQREAQIQVFAVNGTRAVYMLSDGLCYAEVGVAPYTITNGVLQLDFAPSNGVKTVQVTPAVASLPGVSRESKSNDGVEMEFSDLLANQDGVNYAMVVTRPFGNLYGDISFTIQDISVATPAITGVKANNAKLYRNDQAIDMVDQPYPPFAIPRKGLFQYDPTNSEVTTNCFNVATPAQTVDPFDVNEAGWVRVPAGAKVILNGRGYYLNRDYPVKVNPAGVTYCYLSRQGDTLQAIGSATVRETSNSEVLFGISTNGVLSVSNNYLVLDRHLISSGRRGAAIPYFEDDGGTGPNKFFTNRDRI